MEKIEMQNPFELKPYLFPRGQAGLACDVEGVALGPVTLVEKSNEIPGKIYCLCPPGVFAKAFVAAYGTPPLDMFVHLWAGLGRVTKSLEDGDVTLAMRKAIHLKFPEIKSENMAKLAAVELMKAGYNTDECRDERGRWCSDGSAGDMEQVVVTAPKDKFSTSSVYHGKKYNISARQAGNIMFNEMRSFSGPNRDEGMSQVAHVLYNRADAGFGFGHPLTASPNVDPAKVPVAERETYDAAQLAAVQAMQDRAEGKADPTGGATFFNFRGNNLTGSWDGYEHSTVVGPLNNSYPTDGSVPKWKNENNLPGSGVYVHTYYNKQVIKPK